MRFLPGFQEAGQVSGVQDAHMATGGVEASARIVDTYMMTNTGKTLEVIQSRCRRGGGANCLPGVQCVGLASVMV